MSETQKRLLNLTFSYRVPFTCSRQRNIQLLSDLIKERKSSELLTKEFQRHSNGAAVPRGREERATAFIDAIMAIN